MKKTLDYVENKRNNLLLERNQLYNELKETKNELDVAGNDINKKNILMN